MKAVITLLLITFALKVAEGKEKLMNKGSFGTGECNKSNRFVFSGLCPGM